MKIDRAALAAAGTLALASGALLSAAMTGRTLAFTLIDPRPAATPLRILD